MRFLLRSPLLTMVAIGSITLAAAQTSSSRPPASKSAAWKRYCQPDGGFCFKYPGSWSVLGAVFDGNSVVIAPAQKQDRSLWDAITVARVVPPPTGDGEPLGLNGLIEQASSGLRQSGQDFQTLQRQERIIDHKPAQMLKVSYHEKSNAHDWIEEMIFIEGPDNEIYFVVLKCSPQNLARLEPVLDGVLAGWTLPTTEPGSNDAESTKPKTTPSKPH
ncbi:MAG TPA: hypothetical protein VKG65_12435 [Terriglobales bacterium]|nr:hypothetical protein [Terriglobales bacterium]